MTDIYMVGGDLHLAVQESYDEVVLRMTAADNCQAFGFYATDGRGANVAVVLANGAFVVEGTDGEQLLRR